MTLDANDPFHEYVRPWDFQYLSSHNCGLTIPLRKITERPGRSGTGCLRYIADIDPYKSKESASGARLGVYMHFMPEFRINRDMMRTARNFELTPGIDSSASGLAQALEHVDFHQVKLWLQFCRENHPDCSLNFSSAVPGLKLIDCNSREVCLAAPNQAYAALSYVWGPQSAKNNVNMPGDTACFPQTIEDAILAAKEIGIPYLWVDRYCIDQEDPDECQMMIGNMDKIYSGAELTIIAGSGASPHYGLPGISKPQRPTWRRHLNPGILDFFECPTIEVKPDEKAELWGSRGWTFQEMLLSRRRLIFLDTQVLLQCCNHIFCDVYSLGRIDKALGHDADASTPRSLNELSCPSDPLGLYANNLLPHITQRTSFDIYEIIYEYGHRQLSYHEDKLDAMEGTFGAFRDRIQGFMNHFWGIPILDYQNGKPIDPMLSFFLGLQWYSFDPFPARGKWPSWSWASRSRYLYHPDSTLSLHAGVSVRFRRLDGHAEDAAQFAYGPHRYLEYQPWIELTTWVGPFLHLEPGVFDFGQYMPIVGDYAIYVGVKYKFLDRAEVFVFLTAEQTDDGSFRRLGIAYVKRNADVDWFDEVEEQKWKERIREQTLSIEDFFEGWEHKTIRLV